MFRLGTMLARPFGVSLPRCSTALTAAFGSLVLVAGEARGDVSEGCQGLGAALVDHSCFHSTYGPFATRAATAGSEVSATTPNLDPVHTEYRVGLAGSESSVTYEPNRSGAFSVFLGADVPVRILQDDLLVAEIITFTEGTGCDALPVSRVFELSAFERYQVVFGPTSSHAVVVVIEYVDDFLIDNGRDADRDGYGNPSDVIRSVCVPPDGYVQNASDCDDSDPTVHPAARETCGDQTDQNCNGLPDDLGLACSAGEGACRRNGELACDGGNPFCSATVGESTSEACNGVDDDCNGRIDDAANLCPASDRPTCVREEFGAFCGCLLDLDCGPSDSGRVCLLVERRCAAGCSREAGRNGCPAGYECEAEGEHGRCELEEEVPPSDGGAGGEGGSGHVSATGGAASSRAGNGGSVGIPGGATGGRGVPDHGSSGAPTEDGGRNGDWNDEQEKTVVETRGCGCRVGAPPSSTRAGSVLVMLALFSTLRRRRARALLRKPGGAFVTLALVACACGGQSIRYDSERNDGHGHANQGHSHAGETGVPSTGGSGARSSAGGAGPGGTAGTSTGGADTSGMAGTRAGTAGSAGSPCVPELGEEPVAHACSHMTLGPFVPVAALGPAHATTASVSTIQTAFEVDVVEAGARLSYVASRDGTHVILTDRVVQLSVRDQSSRAIDGVAFSVSGCDAIEAAVSVLLATGEAYTVEIGEPDVRSFDVFIEHLGTFGDEAWARSCGN
jgi:MYXO-CTERM domain-containing protein